MHFLVSQIKKQSRPKTATANIDTKAEKKGSKASNQYSCPHCGNTHLVNHYMDGHFSCTECGAVTLQNIISEEQEWREFEDDPKSKGKSRAASAIDDSSVGLTTSTGTGKGKAAARVEADLVKSNAKQQKLNKSYKKIDEVAAKLKILRTVKQRAKTLYKDLSETNAFQGRRQKACIAAVIFYASQLENISQDIKHLEVVTGASKKEITKAHKSIKRALSVKKTAEHPVREVQDVCDQLQLGQSIATASKHAVEQVYHQGHATQRTSKTIAAAVIILVLKDRNQWTAEKESQITTALRVSKGTVVEYLRELSIYKNAILATS